MTPSANTIHVAIEVSNTIWLVGTHLPGGGKPRMHRLAAGDVTGLLRLLADLRARVTAGWAKRLISRAASTQAAMGSGCIVS